MASAIFNTRRNTVFINTDIIKPQGLEKLGWRDRFRIEDEVHAMSYEERLKRYATPEQRKEVEELINQHQGCQVSEYC